MPQTDAIKTGTRHAGDREFVGVVRHGRKVIVECGHTHTNRDWSTGGGRSAKDCADEILRGARREATAEHYATSRRNAWERLTRGGHTFTADTIASAKEACAADAEAYLAAVAAVRTLLAASAAA